MSINFTKVGAWVWPYDDPEMIAKVEDQTSSSWARHGVYYDLRGP